jgi:hypothetical protein
METKANAYAVLKLCLDDPHYSNADLQTDICGHIAKHMGREHFIDKETGTFPWSLYVNHIGMAEYEWPLWQLLLKDWLSKEEALKVFAEMILFVHGPEDGVGIPENLRLL